MELMVGFEFEFGWKPTIANTAFAKKTKKSRYFETVIYSEVKNSLNSFLESYYQHILDIKEDVTIKFSKNYWEQHYGAEVVTEPLPQKKAILILEKILSWLQTNPSIKTNKTCSLHVNISFFDRNITESIDYLSLLKNTPTDLILAKFKRSNNVYCKSAFKKKFLIEHNMRVSKERTYDYWKNKINEANQLSFLTTNISFGSFRYNPTLEKHLEKIQFNSKQEGIQYIEDTFKVWISKTDKNISVVEKINPAGVKYFEFRMIGNSNYQYKKNDIHETINYYLNSMRICAKNINDNHF